MGQNIEVARRPRWRRSEPRNTTVRALVVGAGILSYPYKAPPLTGLSLKPVLGSVFHAVS